MHRNGGGHVRRAITDILALDQLVGLEEIMVIHHTDCGTLRYTNEGMRQKVIARMGPEIADEVNQMVFGAMTEYVSSLFLSCN